MNTTKISIIVPVYKAESYIHRCLDSILHQTFKDWECILVDDGSPDRSGVICDEYSKLDSRFITIHKPNGGVSNARQTGLDSVKGEYIIHVDPDDWIESFMLEELYFIAYRDKADMVICDFIKDYPDHSELLSQQIKDLSADSVLIDLFCGLHGSCCNKLVKREVFDKYKISFPRDWTLCEDHFVIASILSHSEVRVSYINKAFYHYVLGQNENSMSIQAGKNYEFDVKLYNTFDDITHNNHAANAIARRLYAYNIILREYNRKEASSILFVRRCLPYLKEMALYSFPLSTKIKLVLSCMGLYRLILKYN